MRSILHDPISYRSRHATIKDISQNPFVPSHTRKVAETPGLIKVDPVLSGAYNQVQTIQMRQAPYQRRNFVSPRPELCTRRANLRMGGRSMKRPEVTSEFQKVKHQSSKMEERKVKKNFPDKNPEEIANSEYPSLVHLFNDPKERKVSNKNIKPVNNNVKQGTEESKNTVGYVFPKRLSSIYCNSSIIITNNHTLFQSEFILLKIKQYLSYEEFIVFFTSSKDIYNKKVLNKIQAEMILKGLDNNKRKSLWLHKCKILYNMMGSKDVYKRYYSTPSGDAVEIKKDITRTFDHRHTFCNDTDNYNKLQRVLHAFAVKHPEIGYVQGLNFVVGNLLIQFPEEVMCFLNTSFLFGH